jgi:hypothetical protein
MFGAVATKAGVINFTPPESALSGRQLALCIARRVAIAAGHNRVHNVGTAFELRCGARFTVRKTNLRHASNQSTAQRGRHKLRSHVGPSIDDAPDAKAHCSQRRYCGQRLLGE